MGLIGFKINPGYLNIANIVKSKDVDNMLLNAAKFAKNTWFSLSQRSLDSARADYAKSISDVIPIAGGYMVYMDPDNWLANAVEHGCPSFDMKPGLLAGPNAEKYDHKKNVVPIRHYVNTPGRLFTREVFNAATYPAGTAKITQYRRNTMPIEVSKAAQGLEYKQAIEKVMKRSDLPIQSVKEHEHVKKGGLPYLAGLRKMGAPRHTQYITFRTVTAESEGWIHPGITARNYSKIAYRLAKDNLSKQVMAWKAV